MNRRIVVHALMNVPPSAGNRDQYGNLKTFSYRDEEFRRMSSQCVKRSVMQDMGYLGKDCERFASRFIPGIVRNKIADLDPSIAVEDLDQISANLAIAISSGSAKDNQEIDMSKNLLYVSLSEIDFLAQKVLDLWRTENDLFVRVVIDDGKIRLNNGKKSKKGKNSAEDEEVEEVEEVGTNVNKKGKVENSAFRNKIVGSVPVTDPGMLIRSRLDTSKIFRNIDGMIFTQLSSLDEYDPANDYFIAVDDQKPEDIDGAGHIASRDISSELAYEMIVIDVDALLAQIDDVDSVEKSDALCSVVCDLISKLAEGFAVPGKSYLSLYGLVLEIGSNSPNEAWRYLVEALNENGNKNKSVTSVLSETISARNAMLNRDKNSVVALSSENGIGKILEVVRNVFSE